MLVEPTGLSPFAIIGIALGTMFFGYFFGLFEGRGQGHKKAKAEEAEKPKPVSIVRTVDDPGVLRLKVEDNNYKLDMDGTRVNTSALSADQRKRLIDLLTAIRPWLEGKPAPMPASSPPPASTTTGKPASEQFIFSTPEPVITPIPARLDIGSLLRPKPKETKPVEAPTSMVQQIDAILQQHVINTQFANIGLSLEESSDGGVLVKIGERAYQGVGDVPDPQIKAVIQTAITEWEKKYTPGL